MAQVGTWSPVTNIPVFAVHGALIYNQTTDKWKVALFSGGEEANNPPTGPNDLRKSYLWDPDTNSFTSQTFALVGPTDSADPFCAHQCILPDGRLLVMGGAFYGGPHGRGVRATWIFDPISETWSRVADMAFGRWYPTSVVLPDGRVVVASGRSASGGVIAQMEVFDPSTNAWATLPSSANKTLEIYPSLHLVPAGSHAGKIFYTGTRWAGSPGQNNWAAPATALFDAVSNTWHDLASHVTPNRTEGISVLLPPAECARWLVLGGGVTAPDGDPDSAEVIDLLQPTPAWSDVQDMRHARTNVTAAILPNGTVFVFGGHGGYKWTANGAGGDQHAYPGEIYHPETRGWIETAPMQRPRQYHSVGILLPDGRVLCAGGVFPGTAQQDQSNMEIFSPPYMDEPTRPVITNAPAAIAYGDSFTVETPQTANIDRVALIRPMAITHHTDSEQRYVRLAFRVINAATLEIAAPGNPNLAPPGYYMLFLVDACGRPSVAKFVLVAPPTAKTRIKDVKDKGEGEKPIKEFEDFKQKEKEKEFKEKEKEKEFKEIKEKDKEIKEKDKEIKEKDKDIFEGGGVRPALTHFIRPELRPDLGRAALNREADLKAAGEGIEVEPARPDREAKRPASPKRGKKPASPRGGKKPASPKRGKK